MLAKGSLQLQTHGDRWCVARTLENRERLDGLMEKYGVEKKDLSSEQCPQCPSDDDNLLSFNENEF